MSALLTFLASVITAVPGVAEAIENMIATMRSNDQVPPIAPQVENDIAALLAKLDAPKK